MKAVINVDCIKHSTIALTFLKKTSKGLVFENFSTVFSEDRTT